MPDLDQALDDLESWLSRRHRATVALLWWATSDGVVSIAADVVAPSAHERLAAVQRVETALREAGVVLAPARGPER